MEIWIMAYNIKPYNIDQPFLLPPSLRDWLPEGELAWFVLDLVDQMDLRGFYLDYREDGQGHALYDPKMMVTLLIYSYCIGERSSRRIEKHCLHDVSFRVITANQCPDFTTIARFRRDNLDKLDHIFVEVLRLCDKAGLVKLGLVALDGTKMKGNASLSANRTQEQIIDEVQHILKEAEQVDTEEDVKLGSLHEENEIPPELRNRQTRLSRLHECVEQLEAEKAYAKQQYAQNIEDREKKEMESGRSIPGPKPKAPNESELLESKANITDPDSRIMKSSKGFIQGYNAQAIATKDQIIIAAYVTQQANDVRQLHPMLGLAHATLQAAGIYKIIKSGLGDAGYSSEENLRAKSETELLIATLKDWKQRKALREQPPPRGRIPKDMNLRDRMERKLLTKRGRALYKQRGQIIEPIFGQTKDARRIDRFLLRGIEAVDAEWVLICATSNIRKLYRSGKFLMN
jgi:transposase